MQEDWVLCRVFYKKKADAIDYAMDNERDVAMPHGGADHPGYSPPFPAPGSGHYHLPSASSSDHHGGGAGAGSSLSDFPAMALLHHQHSSIFDLHGQPHDGDSNIVLAAAAGSRDDGGGGAGDQCGSGVLMDLGGLDEHYNYNYSYDNSLMQM
jgi:hypothetical protein